MLTSKLTYRFYTDADPSQNDIDFIILFDDIVVDNGVVESFCTQDGYGVANKDFVMSVTREATQEEVQPLLQELSLYGVNVLGDMATLPDNYYNIYWGE